MSKIVVIHDKVKGCDYCGSKRISLEGISIEDAEFILKESPNFPIEIKEGKKRKPKDEVEG